MPIIGPRGPPGLCTSEGSVLRISLAIVHPVAATGGEVRAEGGSKVAIPIKVAVDGSIVCQIADIEIARAHSAGRVSVGGKPRRRRGTKPGCDRAVCGARFGSAISAAALCGQNRGWVAKSDESYVGEPATPKARKRRKIAN